MIEQTDLCVTLTNAINARLDRSFLGRWFGTPRTPARPTISGTPWTVDPNAPTRIDVARPK